MMARTMLHSKNLKCETWKRKWLRFTGFAGKQFSSKFPACLPRREWIFTETVGARMRWRTLRQCQPNRMPRPRTWCLCNVCVERRCRTLAAVGSPWCCSKAASHGRSDKVPPCLLHPSRSRCYRCMIVVGTMDTCDEFLNRPFWVERIARNSARPPPEWTFDFVALDDCRCWNSSALLGDDIHNDGSASDVYGNSYRGVRPRSASPGWVQSSANGDVSQLKLIFQSNVVFTTHHGDVGGRKMTQQNGE